jgi:hypothetical protein
MSDFQTLRFSSERDLQNHCIRVLRSKGIQAKYEVWNGDIRADIVTSRAVIECKKVLDRESIYQAYGQASAYQRNLKREEIWIVGQYPIDLIAKAQAIKIAKEVEKNAKVTVSFIDDDEFWKEDHSTGEWELWRYVCLFLGLVFIALAFTNWNKQKCSAAARDPQVQQNTTLEKMQV